MQIIFIMLTVLLLICITWSFVSLYFFRKKIITIGKQHFMTKNQNLMMTYKNKKDIPNVVMEEWQQYHPDLNIKIYTDEDCITFLQKKGTDEDVEIFRFLKDGPIKADFFRTFYLFHNGGWYADVDMSVYDNITRYLQHSDKFCTVKSSHNYDKANPTFISAKKGNKLCKEILDLYRKKYRKSVAYNYWTYSIVKLINAICHSSEKEQEYIDYVFLEKSSKDIKQRYICAKNPMQSIIFKCKRPEYTKHSFLPT